MLAYLTPDLPGSGGVIKERPHDFYVEEQPLYTPSGYGEHLWLYVEKQHRATTDVIRRLAKLFRVSRSNVGYAGLKDKYAVTRQLFSITLPDTSHDEELIEKVGYTGTRVLWASRHTNKLKRGHLSGNQFVIRIRGAKPGAAEIVTEVMDRLSKGGTANFVGQQRFGYRANNHELGKLLLQGRWQEMLDLMLGDPRPTERPAIRAGRQAYERGNYQAALDAWPRHMRHDRQALDALRQGKSAQEAVMSIDRQQRGFLISSFQSAIFNRALNHRIRDGSFDRLVEGDLAWKHDSRAVFEVDRATAEIENAPQGRVSTLAVSPSGPMWGAKMPKAAAQIGQMEQRLLAEQGLDESDLAGGGHAVAEGKRRPLRVVVQAPEVSQGVDPHGPYLQVSFGLPAGSYATVVLREFMKPTPLAWEELA